MSLSYHRTASFLSASVIALIFAAAESCGSPMAAESPGPKGDPGVSGYEVITDKVFIPIGVAVTMTLSCPLTKVAISSGWSFHGSALNVLYNFPGTTTGEIPTASTRNQWTFKVGNTGNIQEFVELYVICAYAG